MRSWNVCDLKEVLGPERGRFFGEGYRKVQYGANRRSACNPRGATYDCSVDYPEDWSITPMGNPRQPHLSTVDATILPLLGIEYAMSAGPANESMPRFHVSELELRSGNQPWNDLQSVPMSIRPVETNHSEHKYRATVGNIDTKLTLRKGPTGSTQEDPEADPAQGTPYGSFYRFTECRSTIESYSNDDREATGSHRFTTTLKPYGCPRGIEGSVWPAVSIADYLVTMGQMVQALVQLQHGTGRAGTLWMRSVSVTRAGLPSPLPTTLQSHVSITRDRLVRLRERHFRDLRISAQISDGTRVSASLAQEEGAQ